MGQNSKSSSGADAAGNLLYFSPEKLTVVTDKAHPLYDERVDLPLDEALVLNIMAYGVIEPVVVRNNGRSTQDAPIIEVVVGRQRVRACMEANRRLKKTGAEQHRVPAIMKRAEASTLVGVMISENEIRRDDSPLIKARKLARYLSTGKTEEEAAITFGVTGQTIRNMIKILELHPTVQKAIEKGLPTNVAKELSTVPQEEQPAALEKLVKAGTIKGARGIEAAKRVRNGEKAASSKSRMMNKNTIAAWKSKLRNATGKDADMALAILNRILGQERALSNYPKLRETLEAAEA